MWDPGTPELYPESRPEEKQGICQQNHAVPSSGPAPDWGDSISLLMSWVCPGCPVQPGDGAHTDHGMEQAGSRRWSEQGYHPAFARLKLAF